MKTKKLIYHYGTYNTLEARGLKAKLEAWIT